MAILSALAAVVACFGLRAALSIAGDIAALRKAVEDVESNTTAVEEEEKECMPAGKLLFLHIMKNGGTAIDVYLSCKCELLGCSMAMRLGPYKDVHGRQRCGEPAALCSTHGRYMDRK